MPDRTLQELHSTAPNPVEDLLGYHIRRASAVILSDLNLSLGEIGLTVTEATVLMFIESRDGITQSELGRHLSIKRANMAPLTANLTRRGLVDRSQADGRSQLLRLTTEGQIAARETRSRVTQHDRKLCSTLSQKQRQALIQQLETIWR